MAPYDNKPSTMILPYYTKTETTYDQIKRIKERKKAAAEKKRKLTFQKLKNKRK